MENCLGITVTEVQVFDGEGINWNEVFPEGPTMACVQVAMDPVPINEVTKVWVQHTLVTSSMGIKVWRSAYLREWRRRHPVP